MKTRPAYGLWCPVCQTGKDKRVLSHVDKRRQERAWKKDQGLR
jgi:hypothetical protein